MIRYTHNTDLTHYERNREKTNCGSYALRLNEWYHLNRRFEEVMHEWCDTWIRDKHEEGYSDYEISCMYGEALAECMLEDFKGELELCSGKEPTTDDVELIAFNTFCHDDGNWGIDSDFHFKVFRDGTWKEKCGRCPVQECDKYYWDDYIGDPIYFYHKIK